MIDHKQRLATNLKLLMEKHDYTQQGLHRMTGVSQAKISSILRVDQDTTMQIVANLGKVFGLECWQMLAPAEVVIHGMPDALGEVVDGYLNADPEGRAVIEAVSTKFSRQPTILKPVP